MRYMDQVWTDLDEVLVRVSMSDLAVLKGALCEVALPEWEDGNVALARMAWRLADQIADVEAQAQLDVVSGWNLV